MSTSTKGIVVERKVSSQVSLISHVRRLEKNLQKRSYRKNVHSTHKRSNAGLFTSESQMEKKNTHRSIQNAEDTLDILQDLGKPSDVRTRHKRHSNEGKKHRTRSSKKNYSSGSNLATTTKTCSGGSCAQRSKKNRSGGSSQRQLKTRVYRGDAESYLESRSDKEAQSIGSGTTDISGQDLENHPGRENQNRKSNGQAKVNRASGKRAARTKPCRGVDRTSQSLTTKDNENEEDGVQKLFNQMKDVIINPMTRPTSNSPLSFTENEIQEGVQQILDQVKGVMGTNLDSGRKSTCSSSSSSSFVESWILDSPTKGKLEGSVKRMLEDVKGVIATTSSSSTTENKKSDPSVSFPSLQGLFKEAQIAIGSSSNKDDKLGGFHKPNVPLSGTKPHSEYQSLFVEKALPGTNNEVETRSGHSITRKMNFASPSSSAFHSLQGEEYHTSHSQRILFKSTDRKSRSECTLSMFSSSSSSDYDASTIYSKGVSSSSSYSDCETKKRELPEPESKAPAVYLPSVWPTTLFNAEQAGLSLSSSDSDDSFVSSGSSSISQGYSSSLYSEYQSECDDSDWGDNGGRKAESRPQYVKDLVLRGKKQYAKQTESETDLVLRLLGGSISTEASSSFGSDSWKNKTLNSRENKTASPYHFSRSSPTLSSRYGAVRPDP